MQMGADLLMGFVSLLIGAALVFVAMPKGTGKASFLASSPNLVIIYPVLPLLFLVIGVATLVQALL
jgi:hypothetical protein